MGSLPSGCPGGPCLRKRHWSFGRCRPSAVSDAEHGRRHGCLGEDREPPSLGPQLHP